MFYNGANCDIYIGKGAGKKLLHEIRNAKKSIKIVSPYLSPALIKELINFRKTNLDIELITTDYIEDNQENNNIHELIIQNISIDDKAQELREKWKNISKILIYIGYGSTLLVIFIIYYLKNIWTLTGLIPIIILFLIAKLYIHKVKNKQIYHYKYSQLFPFKVYMSPQKTKSNATFIHSKIYLIDEQVAYLGSLNFTSSGTKYNYETRIRTTDQGAVNEIKEEIHQLMHHSHLPERNIQQWGKQIYTEPIN